ncbi:MAG: hypothetical protein IGS03_08720 [Candidatus Sericytochromatia bacterium]|nr:hypothetical protein [Candidatus Sericytochromatia bacterium]
MSLKHFQHSWLDLMAQAALSEAPSRSEFLRQTLGLDASEVHSLAVLPAGILQEQVQSEREAKQALFQRTLPENIQHLLGAEHTAAVLERLYHQGLPLFSPQALRVALLDAVLQYLNATDLIVPHLRDLVHYEQAAAQLHFFRLPAERRASETLLAPWARLIRLGEHFPLFLRQFPHALSSLSETPRQVFLLLRDFQGLKLESLSPLQLECLQACQKQGGVGDFVTDITYEQAQGERTAVFRQYVQRGILLL